MKKAFQILQNPEIQLYGILLALVLLSYSIVLPDLGLYGDDPAFLYTYHRYGVDGFHDYLGGFRPFAPWIYRLITPAFQETIWAYHVFLLILRWLMAVLFYKLLALVWPERKRIFSWAACLMAVYPGFMQQAMPLEFSLHFATFCLLLTSMLLMVQSILQPRRYIPYTIASLLTALSMFGIEYFIGLELFRPVLLGVLVWRKNAPHRWRTLLLNWLPFLLFFLGYLYWRMGVFQSVYYQPTLLQNLREAPELSLLLLSTMIKNMATAGIAAWGVIFQIPNGGVTLLIYFSILAGSIVLLGLFFYKEIRHALAADISSDEAWAKIGLALGVFLMLSGGIPVWAAELRVTTSFPWDRTTLPFMMGACLGAASLTLLLFKPRNIPIFLAVSIAFMVGYQFQKMNIYRREWQGTRDYFWQLIWRAPDLRPDTLIITYQPQTQFLPDNSISAILNWIYDPDNHSAIVHYKLFDLSYRLPYLASLEPGLPVSHIGFSGSTSQALVITSTPGTCLRVLSPEDARLPHLSETMIHALHLTNTDQIIIGNEVKPPAFLGPEPNHGWCYYYAKAALAEQQGNWEEVVSIEEQAYNQGLTPLSPAELTVFIKGYAHIGQAGRSLELSQKAVEMDPAFIPLICQVWENIPPDTYASQRESIASWLEEKKCP